MKTFKYLVLAILVIATSFSLGTWFGFSNADNDMLCGDYADYKLLDRFTDPKGVSIPKGTILKARQCKGNIHLKMGLVIEKWDFPLIEYQGQESKSELVYLTSQKTLDEDAK